MTTTRRLALLLALGARGTLACGTDTLPEQWCAAGAPCDTGRFCNIGVEAPPGYTLNAGEGMCQACALTCSCSLTAAAEAACLSACERTTATGCCCGDYLGDAIPWGLCAVNATACGAADIDCCTQLYTGNGVCNRQGQGATTDDRCAATPELWDARDCGTPSSADDSAEQELPVFLYPVLGLWVIGGVVFASYAAIGDILTGSLYKKHRTQGQVVEGRCTSQWTTMKQSQNSNHDNMNVTLFHFKVAFFVPMMQPTTDKQFIKVEKEFNEVDERVHRDAEQGSTMQVNHLMSATGDPRNAFPEAVMSHETSRHVESGQKFAFGIVFSVFPIGLVIFVNEVATGLYYLPLYIITPIGVYLFCTAQMSKAQANPTGTTTEVGAAQKDLVLKGPLGALATTLENPMPILDAAGAQMGGMMGKLQSKLAPEVVQVVPI